MPPMNELFPLDPSQYEPQSSASLAPLAFKRKGGWDWALPGAIRAPLNDLGIALTAPGNALMKGMTEGELQEAASRSVSGLMAGSGLLSGAPRGAMGALGGGMPTEEASLYEHLWDKFEQAYKAAKTHFSNSGININTNGFGKTGKIAYFHDGGETNPNYFSDKGQSLVNKLQSAYEDFHDKASEHNIHLSSADYLNELEKTPISGPQKHPPLPAVGEDEFAQVPWEPDPAPYAPPTSTSKFGWGGGSKTPTSKGNPYGDPALAPYAALSPHPLSSMREYSPSELDWEYNREYLKYAKDDHPNAFESREDFQQKYDRAPLRHLTPKEMNRLGYFAPSRSLLRNDVSPENKIEAFHGDFGQRRDTSAILDALQNGQTAPPIVLQHDNGLRLMSGNTRLNAGLATGVNVPAKVIDIRKRPLAGSSYFDESPPLPPEQASENFQRWFEGSQVTDSAGNPLMMLHATEYPNIKSLDAKLGPKGSHRPFVSLTSSPEFASKWVGQSEYDIATNFKDYGDPSSHRAVTHYPTLVSAKNPGDFRNPEHVQQLLDWHRGEEYRRLREDGLDVKQANWEASNHVAGFEKAIKGGAWEYWENPKAWHDLGWDGAYMRENWSDPKSPLNIAIPNPGQIKSIFNKGEWDPNNPDISHAGGSFLGGTLAPLFEPVDYDPWSEERKENK